MISKNLHETDSLLLTVVFHARLLAVVRNKAVVEHLLVESETDVILQHQVELGNVSLLAVLLAYLR